MVVGPAREAADAVGFAAATADHDHRQVGVDLRGHLVGGADAVEQHEPAAVVEPQIEQHQRGVTNLDLAYPLGGAARHRDAVAIGDQVVGEILRGPFVVFDYQESVFHGR